ncbi:MAG: glutaminyl-peptide cyclotransferase [Bacteroidales bacterium]|nr:glutaminyl-peptide cyclotransferase [Bacteroidales bacterium]
MRKFSNIRIVVSTAALLMLSFVSCAKVDNYKLKVVAEYSHDSSAYTQGLSFNGSDFIESTGGWGTTTLRKVDLASGKVLRKLDFERKYFGEGSVVLDGKLYMLTWTNKVAFIYDAATLEYLQTYSYPREGWGLTTDGKSLIASDGSSRIYFLSPDFKLQKTLNVTLNGRPLNLLNELEWIDGRIWANVYTTDMIVIINPSTGEVEGRIDCTGLLPKELRTPSTDVLNGIAQDPGTGKIYLTGKNWPRLYEIVTVRQK